MFVIEMWLTLEMIFDVMNFKEYRLFALIVKNMSLIIDMVAAR